MDLYASGTSTEASRLALTLAAARQWLAAIADVTAAFLLAERPQNMPKYGLTVPKVVKDSGHEGSHIWVAQRPLYALRESPVIWAEFRNAKLRKLKRSGTPLDCSKQQSSTHSSTSCANTVSAG